MKKELKNTRKSKLDEYFKSAKKESDEIIITIVKTDSQYKDLPLSGSCICINFGIELAPSLELRKYIDTKFPEMNRSEMNNLYTDIAATLWEEYGNMTIREMGSDGILHT